MRKSKIKIIIVFFAIIIFLCLSISSCNYEGFETFKSLDKVSETGSGNSINKEEDVGGLEYFLELKAKQENKKPLSDINIRKAIFYAIDREEIVNELFGDYNEVLNSLFTKGSYFYSPSWSEYNYDPDKAKDFLEKAGYGPDNPLYITIGSRDNYDKYQVIEDMIKENLNEIGIKIWIFNKPPEEWIPDHVMIGDYELGLWMIKNSYGRDLNCMFDSNKLPSYETDENSNCLNFYWYSEPGADGILDKIVKSIDSDEKKDLLGRFQDILANDAVVLPLYSRLCPIAYNNEKLKEIDVEIKNNEIFFNIDNWNLNGEEDESEIVIGLEGEFNGPIDLFNLNCIKGLLIEGLWEINEVGEYEPVLVGNDQVLLHDEEDKVIRVRLKDDIFWEDGNPITSMDVKYTFDTMLENEGIMYVDEDFQKIEGIEIINDKEFDIIFNEYFEDWKKFFSIIFPEDLFEGMDIYNFNIKNFVSSGPYRITKNGDFLVLERNEFYSGKLPSIDKIKILFDSDINNLIGMLREGEIDLVKIPSDLELMESLRDEKGIDLLIQTSDQMEHLAISLKPLEE